MVENASAEQGASLHRHGLDPGTPRPQQLQTSELPDDESPRDKRRREWQNTKIGERREKQRQNRGTSSADGGDLMGLGSAVAETTQNAPLSAFADHAADFQDIRPHDRTPGQWKTIQKLQLCSRCLTRTIPPHKPKDEYAPCKDRPSVEFDEAYISAIRKGLAREGSSARRMGRANRMAIQPGGRKQQTQSAHPPSQGDKHTAQQYLGVNVQYGHASPGQQMRSQPDGADVHGMSSHAPLYNFRGSSSCRSYASVYPFHGRHNAHSGTGGHSSITLEHPEWAGLVPKEPRCPAVLKSVNAQPVTPPEKALAGIDMLGMTPATPSIPEIHVEGATELASVTSRPVGLLPDSDIGALMLPTSNPERDWDSVTNVAEAPEQTKLPGTVDEGPSSSKLLIEKLMGDAKAFVLSAERSWTLKGLCPSPNPSDWDDATMVEEPLEFSLDFESFDDKLHKVLRPAHSAESFFATRQGTFWL